MVENFPEFWYSLQALVQNLTGKENQDGFDKIYKAFWSLKHISLKGM